MEYLRLPRDFGLVNSRKAVRRGGPAESAAFQMKWEHCCAPAVQTDQDNAKRREHLYQALVWCQVLSII